MRNNAGFTLFWAFTIPFCLMGAFFAMRDHYFAKGYGEGYRKGLVTGRRGDEYSRNS